MRVKWILLGGAALVAGQPEAREYQVQAYQNNQYVGPSSPIVAVVTLP